jgi:hypothetical protein
MAVKRALGIAHSSVRKRQLDARAAPRACLTEHERRTAHAHTRMSSVPDWLSTYLRESPYFHPDNLSSIWLNRLCNDIKSGREKRTEKEIKQYVHFQMLEDYEERKAKNDAMIYKHSDMPIYTGARIRDVQKEIRMIEDVKFVGYIGGNSR